MTDTVGAINGDLFAITDRLRKRVRFRGPVDYNRLTADEKQAANALLDEAVVKLTVKDGRRVLAYSQAAPFFRLIFGGFL